jgi:hypothetical protein
MKVVVTDYTFPALAQEEAAAAETKKKVEEEVNFPNQSNS